MNNNLIEKTKTENMVFEFIYIGEYRFAFIIKRNCTDLDYVGKHKVILTIAKNIKKELQMGSFIAKKTFTFKTDLEFETAINNLEEFAMNVTKDIKKLN